MITLPGYRLTQLITSDASRSLFHGEQLADRQPVLIRILHSQPPSQQDRQQFQHEFALFQQLSVAHLVRPLTLLEDPHLAMVLQTCSGIPLSALPLPLSIAGFLELAQSMAGLVAQLHSAGVIHRDLQLGHILRDPQAKTLTLVDLRFATWESDPHPLPDLGLPPVLTHISPEQTGRMNWQVDHRSDYYTLGVHFYYLLTGVYPLQAQEPLEWIHQHLAQIPVAPHRLRPEIPISLSDLVMKLLAKNPQNRYQSAFGLQQDLLECWHQWQESGQVVLFPLGQRDPSAILQWPDHLYGRRQEICQLQELWQQVQVGSPAMLLLVRGAAGTGKSALVQSLRQVMENQPGYFVAGKFDQFQRHVPYGCLVQAFQGLIRQLLTQDQAQIQRWKALILQALHPHTSVIVDVIPELALITGEQQPVPTLGSLETRYRFNATFKKFLRVFTQPQHPLVLFLDDLQWADLGSLHLLQDLLQETDHHDCLMIAAYRDGEVDPTHPLAFTLQEIQKSGITVHAFTLQNLALTDVLNCLEDILQRSETELASLAELLYQTTEGNPFFLRQLFRSLAQERLIAFDFEAGQWQWNLASIQKALLGQSVLEFVQAELLKLPKYTQAFLKAAACLGYRFSISILTHLLEQTWDQTLAQMQFIQEAGLITQEKSSESPFFLGIPLEGMVYSPDSSPKEESSHISENSDIFCSFIHDRVQQAANSLLSDGERQEICFKIGKIYLKQAERSNQGEDFLDYYLFDIVNYWQVALPLLGDSQDYLQLAHLSKKAGDKAKESSAYEAALKYFLLAVDVVPAEIWQSDYYFAFDLHLKAAECEYINRHFEEADQLFDYTLLHASSSIDQAKVYSVKLLLYYNQGRYAEVLQLGREGLLSLGEDIFPSHSTNLNTLLNQQIDQLFSTLGSRSINSLKELPLVTDERQKLIMKLLAVMVSSAYFSDADTYFLLSAHLVYLSMTQGITEDSAYAYASFGIFMGSRLADYQRAYAFGEVGIQIAEEFPQSPARGRALQAFSCHIDHWVVHVRKSRQLALKSFQYCLEAGDLVHAGFASTIYSYRTLVQGDPLTEVEIDAKNCLDFLTQIQFKAEYPFPILCRTLVHCLQQPDQSTDTFDKYLQETEKKPSYLVFLESAGLRSAVHLYYILKTQFLYLFGHFTAAEQSAKAALDYEQASVGQLRIGEHAFYYALTLVQLSKQGSLEKQTAIKQAFQVQKQRIASWAKDCPDNYQHKLLLLEAEEARLEGNDLLAMQNYDLAIDAASEQKFMQNQALIYELAGSFYHQKGLTRHARTYLKSAYHHYQQWGSVAKVSDLENRYPDLKLTTLLASSHPSDTSRPFVAAPGSLDLVSVTRASQALSSQIDLPLLLETLMQLVIENAGAEYGALILSKNNQLVVEAVAQVNQSHIHLLQSQPINTYSDIPFSIIYYVQRTQESLIINDARQQQPFNQDPYVQVHQPKSILCSPIFHQGRLTGIFYLENNLTTSAFTPDRLEILSILSSQAAISIENAFLYSTLEQRVAQRTQQLTEKNHELELTLQELQNQIFVRQQTEAELGKSLSLLKATLDATADGILATDLYQKVIAVNRRFAEMWEIPESSLLNFDAEVWLALMAHQTQDPQGFISGTQAIYCHPQLISTDLVELASGRIFERYSYPQTINNTIAGRVWSYRDITEYKKVERMKNEFVSMVSHELRTPMTSIQGSLGLINGGIAGRLPDQVHLLIDIAYKNTRRLVLLINDILDIEKIESGKMAFDLKAVDLVTLVQQSIEASQAYAKQFEVVFQLENHLSTLTNADGEGDTSANFDKVLVDSNRLMQVMINLLSNAAKFSPPQSTVTVSVQRILEAVSPVGAALSTEAELQGEPMTPAYFLRVAVSDHGPGIPAAFHSQIFQKFAQADSSDTRQKGGTGLGLSICKAIIENMGGKIDFVTEEGKGTTFYFDLPPLSVERSGACGQG
ncbi:MAG: AAA family ATPase [Cyanobacteriota bacterium]|nr:AAA family ATPase [Cyanobacteriota bacterium]